jgi:hypothetical protein
VESIGIWLVEPHLPWFRPIAGGSGSSKFRHLRHRTDSTDGEQDPGKLQAFKSPSSNAHVVALDVEVWSCFGIWSLEPLEPSAVRRAVADGFNGIYPHWILKLGGEAAHQLTSPPPRRASSGAADPPAQSLSCSRGRRPRPMLAFQPGSATSATALRGLTISPTKNPVINPQR